MSFIHDSFLEADTKGSYCLSSMAWTSRKMLGFLFLSLPVFFCFVLFCFVLFCFSNCSTSKVTRLPSGLYRANREVAKKGSKYFLQIQTTYEIVW